MFCCKFRLEFPDMIRLHKWLVTPCSLIEISQVWDGPQCRYDSDVTKCRQFHGVTPQKRACFKKEVLWYVFGAVGIMLRALLHTESCFSQDDRITCSTLHPHCDFFLESPLIFTISVIPFVKSTQNVFICYINARIFILCPFFSRFSL